MARDRAVTRGADGSVSFEDTVGFLLKFQLTRRTKLEIEPELVNSPGAPPARGFNRLGAWHDAPVKPRTLSHIVCFTPDMPGMEHLAFHMQGPGRHKLGSNGFWYFNYPLMTHFEYDADMDLHDDSWVPRAVDIGGEAAQLFLFRNVAKWFPGDGPGHGLQRRRSRFAPPGG
jgi:hypothetical protein